MKRITFNRSFYRWLIFCMLLLISVVLLNVGRSNLISKKNKLLFRSKQLNSSSRGSKDKNAMDSKISAEPTSKGSNSQKLQPVSSNDLQQKTVPTLSKLMLNISIVNVGFFEGFRRAWNYPGLFQPPPSPRTCECFYGNKVKFYANVTLEKNASHTTVFDVLFFPQDVSISPYRESIMDKILAEAPRYQKRIYASFECGGKLQFLALNPPYNKKMFHWSLTYHSQSDFPTPYGYYKLLPKERQPLGPQINWAQNKRGLVAWMSTWNSKYWKRGTFVQRLKEHLSIDLFGEGQGWNICPRNSTECKQKIQEYKFYLALESACCSEYISEKFWRTLSWDIVPIVVGASRESYERLAPPHSFIYADDFKTVQDLAQYIQILDSNDDLYNEYFRWKENGEIIVNYPDIKGIHVKSRVPPKGFFYSCNAVCRVSNRYLEEKNDPDSGFDGVKKSNTSSAKYAMFDPNVSWWWNSCTQCGKQNWIYNLKR